MTSSLKEIPVSSIIEGDRFRKEYDIADLVESIQEYGVLQPITVTKGDKRGTYLLMAGGRRFASAKQLGLETIPALVREIEGDLDLREIEYIENSYRKDLTWVERMNLVVEIHRLMAERHGDKWNQRKTAQKLEKSVGGINRLLQLHQMAQKFPKILEEGTEDDAVKKARKILELVTVNSLVAKHSKNASDEGDEGTTISTPRSVEAAVSGSIPTQDRYLTIAKNADNHYQIGDAFVGMEEIIADPEANPPIGLIEVDPPYGIDLKAQKKGDLTPELARYEEVEANEYGAFLERLCQDIYNIAPRNCRVIFWFGVSWYAEVRGSLERAGFDVDPIPGLWVKPSGQANNPDLYLARTYETFFIASKGDGIPIRERGRSNVFAYSPVPAARKYHPTQRPIELMQEILRTFAWPNTIVLVPFLGSGVTLRAAYKESMIGFGWELNEANKPKFIASVQQDIDEYTGEEDD